MSLAKAKKECLLFQGLAHKINHHGCINKKLHLIHCSSPEVSKSVLAQCLFPIRLFLVRSVWVRFGVLLKSFVALLLSKQGAAVADCFDAAAKVRKRFLVFAPMRPMEKTRVLLSAKLSPQSALRKNLLAAAGQRYYPEQYSIGEVLA